MSLINFQSKEFGITAPAVWNSLSPVTKCSATITTFKSHLKTELFSAAYDLTFLLPPAPPIQTLRHTAPLFLTLTLTLLIRKVSICHK